MFKPFSLLRTKRYSISGVLKRFFNIKTYSVFAKGADQLL